jgi:hypothetical protein
VLTLESGANRVQTPASSSSSTSTSPPKAVHSSNQLGPKLSANDNIEEWLYDGENERDGAWVPPSSSAGKGKPNNPQEEQQQLRWTKRTGAKSPLANAISPPVLSPSGVVPTGRHGHHILPSDPPNPFEIGTADDEASDPSESSPVRVTDRALPSDAVDLMVEDPKAVREIIQNEIKRGEPATHAPKHVYRRGWDIGENGGKWDGGADEVIVYEDGQSAHGHREEDETDGHDRDREETRAERDGEQRPSRTQGTSIERGKTKMTSGRHMKMFDGGDVERDGDNPWT